jgi:hypothetical protein
MTITALNNQSLFDLAVQCTGSIENTFLIAQANNLSITDLLVSGSQLVIPAEVIVNSDIKNYFDKNKIHPATGTTDGTEDGEQELEGISYWIINKNFIVQ